jgi:hypothetical protein
MIREDRGGSVTASERPPARRSFILTLWQEGEQEARSPGLWRFSLEDPRTGQRRAFPTLGALFVALEQELAGEGMSDHKPWASR